MLLDDIIERLERESERHTDQRQKEKVVARPYHTSHFSSRILNEVFGFLVRGTVLAWRDEARKIVFQLPSEMKENTIMRIDSIYEIWYHYRPTYMRRAEDRSA